MNTKNLKVIAYTFVRYSYQFDANKPFISSKAKLFMNSESCDKAMKEMVDKDFAYITTLSNTEDWAHKFTDIDECSGQVEYEIRAYEREDHDSDFAVLYQYKEFPIYCHNDSNHYRYRGFDIVPVLVRSDKGGVKTGFRPVKDGIDIDIGVSETIDEIIDDINHFMAYMHCINNDIEEEE